MFKFPGRTDDAADDAAPTSTQHPVCAVCCELPVSTAFEPCQHPVACAECALVIMLTTQECPSCALPAKAITRWHHDVGWRAPGPSPQAAAGSGPRSLVGSDCATGTGSSAPGRAQGCQWQREGATEGLTTGSASRCPELPVEAPGRAGQAPSVKVCLRLCDSLLGNCPLALAAAT